MKQKKNFLCLLTLFVSITAKGQVTQFTCGGLLYAPMGITDDAGYKTCKVIGISGSLSGDLNLPYRVHDNWGTDYDVYCIGDSAFKGCSDLTSVSMSSSYVHYIYKSAFYGCSSLTSLTFDYYLKSIGESACYGCSSLTSLTIPCYVTFIGTAAFSSCSSLTSITVLTAGSGWYPTYDSRDDCNAIIETNTNTLIAGCKNTVIPNSVTAIGDYAFEGCSGLTSLTIPNSVTAIGDNAFSGCSSLTPLAIPNSVTAISSSAFKKCI